MEGGRPHSWVVIAAIQKAFAMPLYARRVVASRRRGFSLPELLVVLVIICFATTVALLAYGNYRRAANVRSGAEKVKSIIVQARTRAIASNQPSAVVFDLTNQALWIDDLDNTLAVRTPKIIPPEGVVNDVLMDEVKVGSSTVTTGLQRAIFRPDGTNPLITVNLRRIGDDASVDENFYSIQMYPTSAEPKIWPNERR